MSEKKEVRVWKRLTAERKFEIYCATRSSDAPIGEILRKAGLTLDQLREIEETIEASALAGLKARQSTRGGGTVSSVDYEQIKRELQEKEKALAELSVEYTLLKKAERWGWLKEEVDTSHTRSAKKSSGRSKKRVKRG